MRICQCCGQEYTPIRVHQKYCSRRCNNRSYRERNAEQIKSRRKAEYDRYWAKNRDRRNQRRMSGRYLLPNETKRLFLGFCEVCGKILGRKKDYHHWANVADLGLWLCPRCHIMAERVDRGLADTYLKFKGEIEMEYKKHQNKSGTN